MPHGYAYQKIPFPYQIYFMGVTPLQGRTVILWASVTRGIKIASASALRGHNCGIFNSNENYVPKIYFSYNESIQNVIKY